MGEQKEQFLKEVTGHIQSKEARKLVEQELQCHLQKTKNDWLVRGLSAEEAEDKAIRQMGDPLKIGMKMNKLYRPKVDWFLLGLLLMVMLLGVLPILPMNDPGELTEQFLQKKLIFGLFGIGAAIGLMFVDYRKLARMGWLFFGIGVLILYVLRFNPSYMINGEPFIGIPGIGTVGCWIATPFFFLAWARFFARKNRKAWQLALLFVYTLYLFMTIPNLNITFIYGAMVMIMLWWSHLGRRTVLWLTIVPIGVSAGIIGTAFLLGYVNDYQMERFFTFLNPENYADGSGYMYLRLSEVMSGANWFGASASQLDFSSSPHTDFALANVTANYGYAAAAGVIFILFLFVLRMGIIAIGTRDRYGRLLVVGAISLFGLQFFYNIGMIFGILPIMDVSLPFISYGWMPTMLNAFLMGIVLSVYRRRNFIQIEKGCTAD
ncbi:FtsW/RodA/SpoVE family cell cycle protein [Pradoshia sp.]|uniref:FtsW/RodA/SpoVE family cell cycle protein n=1 Tax=Pradoshia sp. TaxID=2651281 RepID=UPI003F044882